jgi:hypothetical protein
MKLAYFVHDLNDPSVHRRVRMLQAAGAAVVLLGFCRGKPPPLIEGIAPVPLGRTQDAALAHRALAVLNALLALPRWRGLLAGCDAIIARQLETLVLAVIARQLHAPATPLGFECLDIHRLMSAPGLVGGLLRGIEGRLLARCQWVMVSSPDFVGAHFARWHKVPTPVILVENKVLAVERDGQATAGAQARPPGPPWRIGWYGVIRCERSLRLLADLVLARPGAVQVVIRGRIGHAMRPAFDAVIAATPGLAFEGAYDRRHDLARLYGAVHFAWAVDFMEDGGNSDWLLPNRLYEAGLFGAIPIARSEVATGAWLARRGVGVLLEGEVAAALDAFFGRLDVARHAALARALAYRPDSDFLYTTADCVNLVHRLTAVAPGRAPYPFMPAA